MLVEMTRSFATVFSVDPAKIHVTGFSRGAFVTWRLICNHSDLFVSAAPGGGGTNNNEMTCFTGGRTPARPIPILFLMGRTDASVGYATLTQIRDGVIANYAAAGDHIERQLLAFAMDGVIDDRDVRSRLRDREHWTVRERARALHPG
jgi:poly(3-hydroxybutyrate) depolymerase